jgi:tetratricopeptide (TPR) repeat protein
LKGAHTELRHQRSGRTGLPGKLQGAALIALLCIVVIAVPRAAFAATSAELNTYHRYVAAGSERLQKGDYRGARDAFAEALRYADTDVAAYLGLGIAALHLQDEITAERSLRRAVELNPREKQALVVLGELAQQHDDLEQAAGYWERALEIDPRDELLKARLERIRREHRTEKDFNRDLTGHFSAKYEGRERIETGRIVLRILEDAYGEIGRALSFYPDREIAVILYSDKQFREVTDAPGWSSGVYDGKIRIPIGGIEQETPALRRLLFHEYTHAAVRALTPRAPGWLNEGLAQHFEGRVVSENERRMLRKVQQSGSLPPLSALEGSFMGLSGQQAAYAYMVSLSSVQYLIGQFGMYRLRMVLDELAAGSDAHRSIQNALLVSFDDFERGWRRSLE